MRDPRFAATNPWEVHDATSLEQLERACALGHDVGVGPVDMARLRRARDDLRGASLVSQRAFRDEFLATARATPERQKAWVAALRAAFFEARDTLSADLWANGGEQVLAYATQRWREEVDPFTVWSYSPVHLVLRGADVIGWGALLIRLQPREGLGALDTLPCPDLMAMVLSSSLHEDRELIEELIAVAPPVIDERGQWVTERSVVALLVTELIIEHAAGLREALTGVVRGLAEGSEREKAERDLDDAEQGELPQWLRRAFGLLLERSDGAVIAIRYLGHLARLTFVDARPPRNPASDWPAYEKGLEALAQELGRVGVGVARMRDVWQAAERLAAEKAARTPAQPWFSRRALPRQNKEPGEGARTLNADGLSLLVGGAYVLGDEAPQQGELGRWWAWFEELLEGGDPGMEHVLLSASPSRAFERVGSVVAALDVAGDQLKETYKKLEPQRRRTLFGRRYDERKGDTSSITLLEVGLQLAHHLHERAGEGVGRESARELFFWIHDAACRLWLTASSDVFDRRKQLVLSSFAFLPFLFKDSLTEALKRTLPRVAVDPASLAEVGALLWHNGIEAAALPELIAEAGFDLIAALRDTQQWAALTSDAQAFPEHLQELADALKVDFTPTTASPEREAEQARRTREAFVESVPWASALLERLEADGCHRLRVMPLDGRGTTWVVQATLPDALRDRFGLAPDLRVLAVKGQVRGHDLRLASSEPEGRDDVDPDLFVVASDQPGLTTRITRLAGPWGQRVPWPPSADGFKPLAEQLERYLPTFDLFERRDPVRGQAFFGRDSEIEEIATMLLSGQAVGIFGLRKVGKSSLLQAVYEAIDPPGAARAWYGNRGGLFPNVYPEAFVVWLDVQGLALRTRDALAERLCDELRERLGLPERSEDADHAPPAWFGDGTSSGLKLPGGQQPQAAPLAELRRLLDRAVNREVATPVCFIIDEYDLLFEGYGGEPGVAGVEQIFALLRSVAQATGRVSLALIGRDRSFAASPLLNGVSNPLLGWVESRPLGPFSPDEAVHLLYRIGRRVGLVVSKKLIVEAYRCTGGHPMLLRQYGSALYEASRERSGQTSDVDLAHVRQLFLRRDAVYTICGEVRALLATRFAGALALLEEAASRPEADLPAVLARHGGVGGGQTKMLLDFGILREGLGKYWVPRVYRDYFRVRVSPSKQEKRSQSGGE